jgi:hypothetical protein
MAMAVPERMTPKNLDLENSGFLSWANTGPWIQTTKKKQAVAKTILPFILVPNIRILSHPARQARVYLGACALPAPSTQETALGSRNFKENLANGDALPHHF